MCTRGMREIKRGTRREIKENFGKDKETKKKRGEEEGELERAETGKFWENKKREKGKNGNAEERIAEVTEERR